MVERARPLSANPNEKRKKYFSFAFVILSHILMFGAAVLTSFLLPKFFSITNYGYVKTFTLYFTYLGLTHFGFIDGLHILLSNKKYDQLDKKHIRTYSRVFTLFELVLSAIAFIIAFFVFYGDNQTVFIFIALSIFAYNFSGYGQQLAIASSRFKLVSISNFVDVGIRLFTILLIWILFKFFDVPIALYFALYIFQYFVTGIIYCFASRDCFFGKADFQNTSYKEFFEIIRTGLPLLFANLLVTLVSSFTSLFIQIAYPLTDSDAYSLFSLAVSMSSIVSPIITAVGVIFFPSIRKMDENVAIGYFKKMFCLFAVLIGIALAFYPIVIKIFSIIVPKYEASFPLFRFLFPSILTNSIIVCVNLNYYKLKRRINVFNIISISCVILMASVLFPLYFCLLKNMEVMDALMIFSLINLIGHLVWLFASSICIQLTLSKNIVRELIFISLFMIAFFTITAFNELTILGFLFFYILFYISILFAFYFNEIKSLYIETKRILLKYYHKIEK